MPSDCFNPQCPACSDKRIHSREEEEQFHPYAGHGYTPETGWTHLSLAVEAKEKELRK